MDTTKTAIPSTPAEGVLMRDKAGSRAVAKRLSKEADGEFIEYLGRAIQDARRSRGWSRRELAMASFCHVATIRYLELGELDPTLSVLRRVCDALGIDLALIPRESYDADRS